MKIHVQQILKYLLFHLLFLQLRHSNAQTTELGANTENSTQTLDVEKDALLAFKRSVRDPRGRLEDWRRRTDPCVDQWPGIQCSSSLNVIQINLPGFGLQGELPNFTNLTSLTTIILPNNSFEGALPEAWEGLNYLQTVDLSGNRLTGNLPVSWSGLKNLRRLFVNENAIEGELPRDWWLLDLEILALAGNQLGGTLPSNWGNMEHIEILDLSQNRLKGTLPTSWGSLETLRVLYLNENSLFGSLPESWSELSKIENLHLNNNSLVGELPQRWRFLLSANNIFLNDNNLGGFIPDGWSAISQSCRIDLSNNPHICNLPPAGSLLAQTDGGPGLVLTGTNQDTCPSDSAIDTQALLQFKAELALETEDDPLEQWKWKGESACENLWTGIHCQNGRVTELDLSGFGLSGSLSDKLSQLSALEELKLQDNHFENVLPFSWDQISTLKHLNLSRNEIRGVLPSQWSALNKLEELDVSRNKLIGVLPPEWSSMSQLRVLKSSQNTINGPLPFSWSSMDSLELLHVQQNIITGALPMTWESLTELTELDLSENQLLGPVPTQWSALENLQVLSLDNNERLCGGLPSMLPSPGPQVEELLSSSCPVSTEEAIFLIELKNEILDPRDSLNLWKAGAPPCREGSGDWPGVQCDSGRVIGLNLDAFNLEGELPSTALVKIEKLEHLEFSRNAFRGSLPAAWSQIQGLKILNVSSNSLTGNLPPEWGALNQLEVLDISNNNLEGSMPEQWTGMVRLQSVDVSGLGSLCDGLPGDLDSDQITIRSENSTFMNSCDSDDDSSWEIPVISILLSVFVLVTVIVWISCFCCCYLEKKKQRQKIMEMVNSSVTRNRQGDDKESSSASPMHVQANANSPVFDGRPGTSNRRTSATRQTQNFSIDRSGNVQNYNNSRTAPIPMTQRLSRNPVNNEFVFFPPMVQPMARRYCNWCPYYGHRWHPDHLCSKQPHHGQNEELRFLTQNQLGEAESSRQRTGFGSIQSCVPSTSREVPQMCTEESQDTKQNQRSELEAFREPQRVSPTSLREGTVLATPLRADSEDHSFDPRRVRSRIPRLACSSHVPGPINEASQSTGHSYSDHTSRSPTQNEENSEERSDERSEKVTQYSSSSSSSTGNFDMGMNEEDFGDEGPSELHSLVENDSWNLETTVEIPNESREKTSSLSAEMFRWLESCQQSGTFDMEDLNRELFTRQQHQQQQQPVSINDARPNFTPVAQRFSNFNVANIDVDGIQSSTKELLFWLESRIDEVKRAPVVQFNRNKTVRPSWSPSDSNLFNYKTSSTMTDG